MATSDFSGTAKELTARRKNVGRRTVPECYFFFDEIQNVEGWEHFVRRLLDTTRIHVILTGSSSRMLTSEMETAMRGRSISREVLPFSFVEYLKYHHVFETVPEHFSDDDIARLRHAMDKYFHLGGFPEIYRYSDPAARIEILQEYNDLAVLRDVIERHKVSNIAALRLLLKALYQSDAQKFSVTGFWKTLTGGMQVKCAKNDLFAFMNYLEEACIIYRTELFSASEKAKLVNPNKVYLVDVGLFRAMAEDPEANRGLAAGKSHLSSSPQTEIHAELPQHFRRKRGGLPRLQQDHTRKKSWSWSHGL